jgi:hypothetical protein
MHTTVEKVHPKRTNSEAKGAQRNKSPRKRADHTGTAQKLGEIPPYEPLDTFCARWGWSRAFAYNLAGRKKIRLVKVEGKTYGDNESALAYLHSCPEAEISPPSIDRHATSQPAPPAARPPRGTARRKRADVEATA